MDIRIKAPTLPKALEKAARTYYTLTSGTDISERAKIKRIKLSADSPEALLINFLNRLIYLLEVQHFIGSECSAEISVKKGSCSLLAVIKGGTYSPETHGRKFLIKAATYHKVQAKKIGRNWELRLVLDI